MSSSTVPGRPTCRLSAGNGNLDVLVFHVECVLQNVVGADVAATFAAEVASYRARDDATYRGVLDIVGGYVELS